MIGPLVSIIMPAYNASAFIKEAITSVLTQTYQNWELIVVDDGSTDDGTSSIVKELQNVDSRIIYFYQTNQRLAAARNSGLKLSQGEWIAFLDADDCWIENKLEAQMAVAKSSKADVIFSRGYYLNDSQLTDYDSITGFYDAKSIYQIIVQHNVIPVLSACVKKEVINSIGYQDTCTIMHGGCEDWDYWLRACKAGFNFHGMPDRLFKYRLHSNGMSKNTTAMKAAGMFVLAKNYIPSLLSHNDQQKVKLTLMASVPFILKNIFEPNRQKPAISYIKLLLKILSISGALVPNFIMGKIKHKLSTAKP